MERDTCPFCGKKIKDMLKHFTIIHEIKTLEELRIRFKKIEIEEKKKEEFRKFVEELNEKLRKGEITGKDFRKATTKWLKEHK